VRGVNGGTIGRHGRALTATGAALAAGAVLLALLSGAGAEAKSKKPGGAGLRVNSKSFRLSQADSAVRYEAICPSGKFPYGGGLRTDPAPANGEGVYPNSYERLGVSRGYHINGTLVSLAGGQPAARTLTVQVVCGSKPGKITPPHRTVFVQPGETRTLTMNCTGNRVLLGGGYQRTTGTSKDGNIITESRAVSSKAWRVTAHGQGGFGGELTGFAYCVRSKRPVLEEASATATVDTGGTGTPTTPGCPKGQRLAFGGFKAPDDGSVTYLGGYFTSTGGWTATAYNAGAAATLTAYGYCLRPFPKG
jgi:hypothetical protein